MRVILSLGLALVAGYLALVLVTHDLGIGPAVNGRPSWPYLVEDAYDRQAYQQRGRWIASGGRPYLDEFSEYPQVTTWLMGLPYLVFDHDVPRGEPFTSRRRLLALTERAGVAEDAAERLLKTLVRTPYDEAAARRPDAPPATWGPRLARQAGVAEAEALSVVLDAWRAQRAFVAELGQNHRAYGDVHHVLMAAWFILLLLVTAANLRLLGASPAYALLLLLPASLYFGFNRFDLVVTVLVGLALHVHLRGRPVLAAAVLGLAVMTKWYPIVLAPLFASHDLQTAKAAARRLGRPFRPGRALRDQVLLPAAAGALVVAAILGVTYVHGDGGLPAVRAVFEWHANERVPNRSSLLTALLDRGQWGLAAGVAPAVLERVFKVLQLAPAVLLAFVPLRSRTAFLTAALAATLCMITFSEFYSPQWVLWSTALMALLAPSLRRFLLAAVVLEVLIYLQMIFHHHAFASGRDDGFWIVHQLRMSALLAVLALTLFTLPRLARAMRAPAAAIPHAGAP